MSKFITFEGGEGSGKTTQSKRLFTYLESQNIEAIWTREIGGTEIAEKIRDIILHNEMDVMTELLLVMSARKDHVDRVILPALKEGKIVICDRFLDSSLCYQGIYMDIDKIISLHELCVGAIYPDITFFIDIPAKEGLQRANFRGGNNKFEDKNLQEHERIRDSFLNLISRFKRIVKINGMQKEDDVARDIMEVLYNKYLK